LPGDAPRFDLYGGRFGECQKTNEKVLWARGYFVSSVWLDEAAVRAYIQNQKQEEE
jgi:putative transposase